MILVSGFNEVPDEVAHVPARIPKGPECAAVGRPGCEVGSVLRRAGRS